MRRLKNIKNNKGASTPFLIIVVLGLVSIFIMTYASFQEIALKSQNKNFLQTASDDLLAGFDTKLLSDYGILAYHQSNAVEKSAKILSKNLSANFDKGFIKGGHANLSKEPLDYQVLETMVTGQKIAEIGVEIAEIHLPKEIIGDLNNIYKWSDSVEKKVRGYEKMTAFVEKMQGIQDQMRDYYKLVESLNELNGYDFDWFENADLAKADYQLAIMHNGYKEAIRKIENIKKKLDEAQSDYRELKETMEAPSMAPYMKSLSFDKASFDPLFSEDGEGIEGALSLLEDNCDRIEDMLKKESFENVEDLNTDIFFNEVSEKESGWQNFLDDQRDKILGGGYSLIEVEGEEEYTIPNCGPVVLGLDQKILLNEYFLGVLQTTVMPEVRGFKFLEHKKNQNGQGAPEVESLIAGENGSALGVKARIFGVRMGCNMIHLVSSSKFQQAKTIGIALGSWFPCGQVIGTGIVLGVWSGLESIYDVETLCDGKGIPFIKTDATWQFDIDIDKLCLTKKSDVQDVETDTSSEAYWSYYYDYLRLFLMMVPDDVKVTRFLKCVQKNYSDEMDASLDLEEMVLHHRLSWGELTVEGNYYVQ